MRDAGETYGTVNVACVMLERRTVPYVTNWNEHTAVNVTVMALTSSTGDIYLMMAAALLTTPSAALSTSASLPGNRRRDVLVDIPGRDLPKIWEIWRP